MYARAEDRKPLEQRMRGSQPPLPPGLRAVFRKESVAYAYTASLKSWLYILAGGGGASHV